jgi:SAM-dependent methyltransferase
MLNILSKALWQVDVPYSNTSPETIHVDLGCGTNPRNPFLAQKTIAADFFDTRAAKLKHKSEFVKVDICMPLPFTDSSIDSVSTFDVLEHIPRVQSNSLGIFEYPFISLMSEIYRVLKPGGIFIALTPAFPSHAAFEHPTHVNYISEGTLNYFLAQGSESLNKGYGYVGKFNLIVQQWQFGAGPFEAEENLVCHKWPVLSKKEKLIAIIKLQKRFLHALSKKQKTHLLWVLSK